MYSNIPPFCLFFLQCDLILAIARLIEFYKHESCGQVSLLCVFR